VTKTTDVPTARRKHFLKVLFRDIAMDNLKRPLFAFLVLLAIIVLILLLLENNKCEDGKVFLEYGNGETRIAVESVYDGPHAEFSTPNVSRSFTKEQSSVRHYNINTKPILKKHSRFAGKVENND